MICGIPIFILLMLKIVDQKAELFLLFRNKDVAEHNRRLPRSKILMGLNGVK